MSKKPTKAEIVLEGHPAPGKRPDLWVVVSHSPHARGEWQISNLLESESAARGLIRDHDLARATIVKIPGEAKL